MIVIATYNGGDILKDLLLDLKYYKIDNDNVCIVDNGSNDVYHLNYINDLIQDNYKILFNVVSGYEVGAFDLASSVYDSDYWFCIQDSVRIKQDIFNIITPKLDDNNVYTFLTFPPYIYDNEYVKNFLIDNYKKKEYTKGIFGCNVFMNNNIMKLIKGDLIIPKNKLDTEGMERGLSLIFDKNKIKINEMGYTEPAFFRGDDIYPFFKKIFKGRK